MFLANMHFVQRQHIHLCKLRKNIVERSKKFFTNFSATNFSKSGNYFKITDFQHYFKRENQEFNCAENFSIRHQLEKKSKNARILSFSAKLGSFQKFTRANLRIYWKTLEKVFLLFQGHLFRMIFQEKNEGLKFFRTYLARQACPVK